MLSAMRRVVRETLDSPPRLVLIGMAAMYVWIFGRLAWRQTTNFGTFGYDMGIYDQGIWLATHFKSAFMTVRDLNFYGHHFNPITKRCHHIGIFERHGDSVFVATKMKPRANGNL